MKFIWGMITANQNRRTNGYSYPHCTMWFLHIFTNIWYCYTFIFAYLVGINCIPLSDFYGGWASFSVFLGHAPPKEGRGKERPRSLLQAGGRQDRREQLQAGQRVQPENDSELVSFFCCRISFALFELHTNGVIQYLLSMSLNLAFVFFKAFSQYFLFWVIILVYSSSLIFSSHPFNSHWIQYAFHFYCLFFFHSL